MLDDIKNEEGDFKDAPAEIREIVDKGIQKMNKFAKKMDGNILYYVASSLDPRVKPSFIESQMSVDDAHLIISEARDFLKKEYPFHAIGPSQPGRPQGMPETMWKTLQKAQPSQGTPISDIDRYIDSPPVGWSHHLIDDGDPEWVFIQPPSDVPDSSGLPLRAVRGGRG